MANKIPGDAPKYPMRYCIFSPTKGVLLATNEVWSYTDFSHFDNCATYDKDQIKVLLSEGSSLLKNTPDAEPYEIYPDKPGFLASQDAVANAGLPRWKDKDTNSKVTATPVSIPGTAAHMKEQLKPNDVRGADTKSVSTSTPESRKAKANTEDEAEPKAKHKHKK